MPSLVRWLFCRYSSLRLDKLSKAPGGIFSNLLFCGNVNRSYFTNITIHQRQHIHHTPSIWNQACEMSDLKMQAVKGEGQIPRDNLQEVAGHGDDLQVVRAIEHVIRKPRISQLVVMEIHRPVSHG